MEIFLRNVAYYKLHKNRLFTLITLSMEIFSFLPLPVDAVSSIHTSRGVSATSFQTSLPFLLGIRTNNTLETMKRKPKAVQYSELHKLPQLTEHCEILEEIGAPPSFSNIPPPPPPFGMKLPFYEDYYEVLNNTGLTKEKLSDLLHKNDPSSQSSQCSLCSWVKQNHTIDLPQETSRKDSGSLILYRTVIAAIGAVLTVTAVGAAILAAVCKCRAKRCITLNAKSWWCITQCRQNGDDSSISNECHEGISTVSRNGSLPGSRDSSTSFTLNMTKTLHSHSPCQSFVLPHLKCRPCNGDLSYNGNPEFREPSTTRHQVYPRVSPSSPPPSCVCSELQCTLYETPNSKGDRSRESDPFMTSCFSEELLPYTKIPYSGSTKTSPLSSVYYETCLAPSLSSTTEEFGKRNAEISSPNKKTAEIKDMYLQAQIKEFSLDKPKSAPIDSSSKIPLSCYSLDGIVCRSSGGQGYIFRPNFLQVEYESSST